MLVVNAALQGGRPRASAGACSTARSQIEPQFERALLALQGPDAAAVLARLARRRSRRMPFMSAAEADGRRHRLLGDPLGLYRRGRVRDLDARPATPRVLPKRCCGEPEVAPIGLGARDTLRLEAGLCLYGHDIDETTTPVEAGLAWTIARRRRAEGGFPGAAAILRQLAEGAAAEAGRHPPGRPRPGARGHRDHRRRACGRPVTSGGFGPTVGAPIAMGYVEAAHAAAGHRALLVVRDLPRPAHVAPLPFVPTRYYRSAASRSGGSR